MDRKVTERQALADIAMAIQKNLRRPRTDEFDEVPADSFFGPFTLFYDEGDQTLCEGPGVSIAWPELTEALVKANALLADMSD